MVASAPSGAPAESANENLVQILTEIIAFLDGMLGNEDLWETGTASLPVQTMERFKFRAARAGERFKAFDSVSEIVVRIQGLIRHTPDPAIDRDVSEFLKFPFSKGLVESFPAFPRSIRSFFSTSREEPEILACVAYVLANIASDILYCSRVSGIESPFADEEISEAFMKGPKTIFALDDQALDKENLCSWLPSPESIQRARSLTDGLRDVFLALRDVLGRESRLSSKSSDRWAEDRVASVTEALDSILPSDKNAR